MIAADLTADHIGRTIAVHAWREALVGALTDVTQRPDSTSVTLRSGGITRWTVVPPDTVITDQEVSF